MDEDVADEEQGVAAPLANEATGLSAIPGLVNSVTSSNIVGYRGCNRRHHGTLTQKDHDSAHSCCESIPCITSEITEQTHRRPLTLQLEDTPQQEQLQQVAHPACATVRIPRAAGGVAFLSSYPSRCRTFTI